MRIANSGRAGRRQVLRTINLWRGLAKSRLSLIEGLISWAFIESGFVIHGSQSRVFMMMMELRLLTI
jgi:hypothetical protein